MRCDVAITPDAATADAIQPLRERYDAFFDLVGPHMTVAFPDEAQGALDQITTRVASIAARTSPFAIQLDRWASVSELPETGNASTRFLIERYPNAKNLIVLLASEGAAEFLQLRRALSMAIPQPQRLQDYPPYLTLGQSLTDAKFAEACAELRDWHPLFRFTVNEMNFYVEQPNGAWDMAATFWLGA